MNNDNPQVASVNITLHNCTFMKGSTIEVPAGSSISVSNCTFEDNLCVKTVESKSMEDTREYLEALADANNGIVKIS